jgi:hypothetical protein
MSNVPKRHGRGAPTHRVAALLVCVFLLGSGVGFALGRWSANRNTELVQTGEIRPLVQNAEVEVRYPVPYATSPCLAVEEPIISYELLQQSPQGFRIRVKNFYANFNSARYTAKGVAASSIAE